MRLPPAVRRLTPDRLRDDVRLRALFVGSGLIPPRTMHSTAESELLRRTVAGSRRAVEIGVYEGSSAVVLCDVLGPDAELHLVDPFGHHLHALPAGWGATERATRRVVARASRGGPDVRWHAVLSQELAPGWDAEIDWLFIDGDHSAQSARRDWAGFSPHVVPEGVVLFHDARQGVPGGAGLPGPTAVVDELFRGAGAISGWSIAEELDRIVVVRRDAA